MIRHMRTTIRLDDGLLMRAKREASRRGITLTALIEQGIRIMLAHPMKSENKPKVELPVCHAGGGVFPGVDLDDSSDILDRMDGGL